MRDICVLGCVGGAFMLPVHSSHNVPDHINAAMA